MPNFRTHVTFSSALGVMYAGAGQVYLDLPLTTCVLAGGVCGLSGMLPDLDSDSSVPLRETLTLAAALAPLLLLDHFEQLGLTHDAMALAAACIYILVRFGIGEFLRRYTVHRGMWHSLPAAAIAGMLGLLIWSADPVVPRLFKAGGLAVGYFSHLLLDQLHGLGTPSRSSLGTPLKLWRADAWANGSTYLKLGILTAWVAADPQLMEWLGLQHSVVHTFMRDLVEQLRDPIVRQATAG